LNPSNPSRPLRIATRASRLALWQAEHVAALLRDIFPDRPIELVRLTTTGDRDRARPLAQMGGIGVFTREVQRAVLDGRADLAVHSLKDLPTQSADGLCLAAVPPRGPVRDAVILPDRPTEMPATREKLDEKASESVLDGLPKGIRVATGSLRRQAQLLHRRPDLQVVDVRGNVETRIRKLDEGQFDALILAEAGLRRLRLEQRISGLLGPPVLFPAVGQGALGIECRENDNDCRMLLQRISDRVTFAAVRAERAMLAELRAGCHAPVGVWSRAAGDSLVLEAVVLSRDGKERLITRKAGELGRPDELGRAVAAELLAQGAARLVAEPVPSEERPEAGTDSTKTRSGGTEK